MHKVEQGPLALAFGGLFALAAAMGIGRFVYTPILPHMIDALGLTADQAGTIAAANFLGYLAGALTGSARALPGHPRMWFLAALFVSALTSALMAAVNTVGAFMLIRFVSGFASAFVLVFATTLVLERLAETGRSNLSALHFAGVGCGIAFSALLVAAIARHQPDWHTLWLVSGAATLGLTALAAALVPGSGKAEQTAGQLAEAGFETTGLRITGPLVRLIAGYGLFGFGYVITATFVSAIARSVPSLVWTESYVWLMVGICAAPSIFLWNAVGRKIGIRTTFALACLIEAAGVSLTVVSDQPLVFLAGAGLLGGTFMGITALGLMEGRRLASSGGPAATRQMLAILTASFGLGQVIGPWFAGQLHTITGSFQAPTLAAAAALFISAALVMR